MSAEPTSDVGFQIGHILFIDIVGYSKLHLNEQRSRVEALNQIVRETNEFQSADWEGKLIRLPTGDGMALVFYSAAAAPVECALEIDRGLKRYPELRVRMGIHSGPVSAVMDVNERRNLVGAGINMAQRVMDCGDAGHILLSQPTADDLKHSGGWQQCLLPLGDCEVKHGIVVQIVNLCRDGSGNPELPSKLKRAREEEAALRRAGIIRRRKRIATAVAVMVLICSGIALWLRIRNAALHARERSVAVLPFENLSEDKANAFFASGIQDEILTRLTKISALKVISNSSTKLYESKPANLRQVANELGVNTILEGSVQKVGNTIRVNVQLIKAATDTRLWAETYDRELIDVLPLESEIASRIAASLKATLSPEEEKRVNAVSTSNPDAYEAYLQGREVLRFSSTAVLPEEGRRQRELYEKAIALDSDFAVAHAALSESYSLDFLLNGALPEKRIKARSEAEEALRLQPDLGEARVALGSYHYRVEKDYDAAARQYALALRALPNDAELLWSMAMMEKRRNHWRAGLEGLQRCMSLNPRDLLTISHLGDAYVAVHNYAAAEETRRHQVEVASTVSPEETATAKEMLADVLFFQTGTTAPYHTLLNELPNNISPSTRGSVLVDIGFLENKADIFLEGFAMIPASDRDEMVQTEYDQPHFLRVKGDIKQANEIIQSFIAKYEDLVRKNPTEAIYHTWLGLWYGCAGRKEEAIREGRRATELVPEAKDAVDGAMMTTDLAMIYAQVGEPELALNLIEHLLTIPRDGNALQSKRQLEVQWYWNPLRQNPRFQKILASPEPKLTYN